MLLENIKTHLALAGLAVVFGTRSENLQPKIGRGLASGLSNREDAVSLIMTENVYNQHKANLDSNKEITVTATFPYTHVSYQLKGTFSAAAPTSSEELEFATNNVNAFAEILGQFFGPEAKENVVPKFMTGKYVTVTLLVKELFNQSPGPGAGAPISNSSSSK
jgi:hypothetical protein